MSPMNQAPGEPPERGIHARYADPLDLIWLTTASRLGMRVERSDEVFASWRPEATPGGGGEIGTLVISTPDAFDPDDCLAQMIFHEICHALMEGPEGLAQRDWGLENIDDRDVIREYACVRLQAALAQEFGLREFMAVTTKWRAYYDALPQEALADASDPATPLARAAWRRATEGAWAAPLRQALEATAAIAHATRPFVEDFSLWARVSPGRDPRGSSEPETRGLRSPK